MFNLLISGNPTAWETDQLMSMDIARFKEHSGGSEASSVSLDKPNTLALLEHVPTLLMYERGTQGPTTDVVRYGYLRGIAATASKVSFHFHEEGRFQKSVVQEFADRLGIDPWEHNRTHWAIKDGGIPTAMLDRLLPTYDVVLSFADEDRTYVELVAHYLRSEGVKVFYDRYEDASLWGKNLSEHFDAVYRLGGRYCVMFISKHYAEKMWATHERRSALARALQERREYILPARFDQTAVAGILPTVAYISLSDKSPVDFGKVILKKLGKNP
jgi:hypothetical protein